MAQGGADIDKEGGDQAIVEEQMRGRCCRWRTGPEEGVAVHRSLSLSSSGGEHCDLEAWVPGLGGS
jgi:hypothetical protein